MKGMTKKALLFMLSATALIMLLFLIMQPLTILQFKEKIALLFPKGVIALKERNLLFISQALMLFVIIPVYLLTFIFCWKYRANHRQKHYDPDLIDNWLAECVWWGFPLVMTLIISAITWQKTYELDPFKPVASDKKAVNIQVIALNWKWLFIYPEEGIASINFFQFPKATPLHFEITADAPMNSFWLPALGGQIYAMPNMKTELNLIADETGDFRGSSANLSGEGFAGMHFVARASSEEEYKKWVEGAKESSSTLNWEKYQHLVTPTSHHPIELYQLKENHLFNKVLNKNMHPKESVKSG